MRVYQNIALLIVLITVSHIVYAEPLNYERRTAVVDVVEKVSPVVVAIRTDIRRSVAVNPFEGFWFGLRGGERAIQEKVFTSAGSGIIVDKKGTVITNSHVVMGANRLTATTSDGEVHDLILIGLDKDFDVAVLQIVKSPDSRTQFTDIDWGRTSDLMIGETVVTMGSALSFENSVSVGVVSAVERTIEVPNRDRPYFGMIQTDAAINRGNSGGPVVNIRGELIGVATLIASEGGGSDGIGFAIPVERVMQVYNEFTKGIVSLEERLGIRYVYQRVYRNIEEGQAKRLGLEKNRIEGLLTMDLSPDGLAYQAGLRRGDLLLQVDSRSVPKVSDFQRILEEHTSGKPLKIDFLRVAPETGTADRLNVIVPTDSVTQIEQVDNWFGMQVGPIPGDVAQALGVSMDGGCVIQRVDRDTPANQAGIAPGDLIFAINKIPIETIGDFRRLRHILQNEIAVTFSIRRGDYRQDVVLSNNPQPNNRRGL